MVRSNREGDKETRKKEVRCKMQGFMEAVCLRGKVPSGVPAAATVRK